MMMRILKKPFVIAFVIQWLLLAALYIYVGKQCLAAVNCAGDFFILFAALGAPWVAMFPMVDEASTLSSILINMVIVSAFVQIASILLKKIFMLSKSNVEEKI